MAAVQPAPSGAPRAPAAAPPAPTRGSSRSLTDAYRLVEVIGSGSYGQAVLAERLDDGEQVVVKQIRFTEMSERERAEAMHEVQVLSQFDHLNIVQYLDCVIEVRGQAPHAEGRARSTSSGCLRPAAQHTPQESTVNIVMEFARLGDLSSLINERARSKAPFSEDEIMFWWASCGRLCARSSSASSAGCHCNGTSSRHARVRGRLPHRRFVQVLLALWHVHSKNVLHRDLKSQNIFIAEGGPRP
jgi:NIMA (never in mitosis gene a)-related kinase